MRRSWLYTYTEPLIKNFAAGFGFQFGSLGNKKSGLSEAYEGLLCVVPMCYLPMRNLTHKQHRGRALSGTLVSGPTSILGLRSRHCALVDALSARS